MKNRSIEAFTPDFLKTMLKSMGEEQLIEISYQILASYGLAGYAKIMEFSGNSVQSRKHEISSLPKKIPQFPGETWGEDSDSVANHHRKSCIPLTWDIDIRIARKSSYDQLKQHGIQSGWSVGIRGENSFSIIEIYSDSDISIFDGIHSELLLFSHYLNEAARTLWMQQYPQLQTPALTARERQCLKWSADGKTSNEIGLILGISQNTVYFHLKKAASKFEVYGTRHAISRAMQMGLI